MFRIFIKNCKGCDKSTLHYLSFTNDNGIELISQYFCQECGNELVTIEEYGSYEDYLNYMDEEDYISEH